MPFFFQDTAPATSHWEARARFCHICELHPKNVTNKQDNILLDLLLWLIKNKNKKNIQRCSKDYYTYDIESYNCRDKKNSNKYGLGEYIKYNNKDGVIININNNNTYNIILYDTFKIINNIKYSNIHY